MLLLPLRVAHGLLAPPRQGVRSRALLTRCASDAPLCTKEVPARSRCSRGFSSVPSHSQHQSQGLALPGLCVGLHATPEDEGGERTY